MRAVYKVYILYTLEPFMERSFQKSLPAIKKHLLSRSQNVYGYKELAVLIKKNRKEWKLPSYLTASKSLNKLLEKEIIKPTTLVSLNGETTVTRFYIRESSNYELFLSLKPESYLSHSTAIFLHGLNDQIPNTVYVNKEQSKKDSITKVVALSQKDIDNVFSKKQRISQNGFLYKGAKTVLLNGQHTNLLGVIEIKDSLGVPLKITNLERTLIDIAVRPAYSGGVYQVLEAYKGALESANIKLLVSMLKKLKYRYPYHQSIGFYLTKAGYPKTATNMLKKIDFKHDFYLDYSIPEKNKAYDKNWQLFYPKGF